ncbi:MAG: Calx-beta domain-containing protein, partial [Cyclobacteriaceae bacterium]
MYKLGLLVMGLFVLVNFSKAQDDLVITGILDGPLSGGLPKVLEIYAINSVADLSSYSLQNATNGNTSFANNFPLTGSIAAGEFLYIGSESTQFPVYFGFAPDLTTGTVNVNGDDVVGLFHEGSLVDIYGVLGVDGTGEVWEHLDGWAYRNNSTGPESTFNPSNWTFSGINVLDACGSETNATCGSSIPLGTYTFGPPPTNTIVQFESASATVSEGDGTYELVLSITNEDATNATTVEVALTSGSDADINTYTTQTVTFAAASATDETVTITITDDALIEGDETLTFTLQNVAGGNNAELGSQTTFDLTITDNDESGIIINEVEYLGTDRIELKNTSDGTVDISAFWMCSLFSYEQISNLTLESGSLSMAPGSITVLSGFSMNDAAADLGLYTSPSFGSASAMTAFVQWGSGGNGRESVAQNRGIWTAGDFIPTVGTGNTIEFDGEGFTSSDWVEQTIPTLGAENSLIETAADIATLRTGATDGTVYRLGGEAIVTHVTGNSRDQIFIEDATGGILIDDNAPIIPASTLALGDGVTNLEGTLTSFGGVLQIIPTSIPTEITTGNTITTQTVTIADFNAAVDDYESELLLLEAVTFTNANGTLTFTEPSSDYSTISDGTNTTTFDADGFLGADYTGDVIPYGRQDLIVLGRENNGTPIVTSRFAVDIQDNYAPLFTVAPSASNETIEGADITFQADEAGSFIYYVLADGATVPSAEDVILNGTSSAYTTVGADVVVTLTGLSDNTAYDV